MIAKIFAELHLGHYELEISLRILLAALAGGFIGLERRITSYNVCYTKLLRHGLSRRRSEHRLLLDRGAARVLLVPAGRSSTRRRRRPGRANVPC